MKIAFHDNSISLRGTTVAVFDYAYWTRKILGNESIILYNKNHSANSPDVYNKFAKEFDIFSYDNASEIDSILSKNGCDVFFMEKAGKQDGVISNVCENWVHAIGICNKGNIHGDKFALGSRWLSKIVNFDIPYVPYMVSLPDHDENMRAELNIPGDAFVFGRNGGIETFDIPWVKQMIIESLRLRNDVWYVFQFTEQFVQHERVIHLNGSSDLNAKTKFINTCDAMLHARSVGESFGLSCAEFSIRNKPVVTWHGSPERSHIDILGDTGIYYNGQNDLLDILLSMKKEDVANKDWNCYKDYSPEIVIEKFKQVYL